MINELSTALDSISIMNRLPGTVFRCKNDLNFTMLFLSDACKKITGYEKKELLENNQIKFIDLIHPVDQLFVSESLQKSIKDQEPFSIEYRIITKDKKEVWIHAQGSGVSNEFKQLLYLEGYFTDITNQKTITPSFEIKENYFRIFYEKSPIPYHSLDEDGFINSVNQAWLNELGYQKEEVIGSQFGSYITENKNQFEVDYEQFKKIGEFTNIQYNLIKKNGNEIEISLSGKTLTDHNNDFDKTYCMFINITEQEKKETQLKEQAKSLKRAQSIALIGSWKWNIQTNHVTWSDGIASVFGYDINKSKYDIKMVLESFIHPEDQIIVKNGLKAILQNQNIELVEFRTILPNGEIRHLWGEIGELIYDEDENPLEIIGIIQDVTNKKEITKQLMLKDAALSAAGNSVVITNSDGIIEWVNPAFENLTGYKSDEAVGKDPKNLLKSGQTPRSIYINMWNSISVGKIWRGEFINQRKDGSLYDEQQVITPIKNEDGTITHFIAIKEDISELKKKEKQLQLKTFLQEDLLNFGDTLSGLDLVTLIYKEYMDRVKKVFDVSEIKLFFPGKDEIYFQKIYAYPDNNRAMETISMDNQEYPTLINILENNTIVKHQNKHLGTIALPMVIDKNKIGVIEIDIYSIDTIENEKLNWLKIITNQAVLAIQNIKSSSKIKKRNAQLVGLRDIDSSINAFQPLERTFQIIINQVISFLDVDAADLLLLNKKNNRLNYITGFGFQTVDPNQQYHKKDYGLPGLVVINKKKIEHINSPRNFEETQGFSKKYNIENFTHYIGLPLMIDNEVVGVLEIFNKTKLETSPEWHQFLSILSGQAEIAINHHALFNNLELANIKILESYDITIEGWSQAMDLRDHETEGHTQRVSYLTTQFAKEYDLSEEEIRNIKRGALLHDIGKLGVPDKILNKKGQLTPDEWKIMKKHPQFAYDILKHAEFLEPSLDIPYCHHEKWDGTGYPQGLKGEEIPLNARLFAFVDVFDAMTSDRPYRDAMNPLDVLEYIQEESGKHFDPSLTDRFIHLIKTNYLVNGRLLREKMVGDKHQKPII